LRRRPVGKKTLVVSIKWGGKKRTERLVQRLVKARTIGGALKVRKGGKFSRKPGGEKEKKILEKKERQNPPLFNWTWGAQDEEYRGFRKKKKNRVGKTNPDIRKKPRKEKQPDYPGKPAEKVAWLTSKGEHSEKNGVGDSRDHFLRN